MCALEAQCTADCVHYTAGYGSSMASSGGDPTLIKLAGVDEDAPRVIGALFEFPNTVDNRIIRLVAIQVGK